MNEMPARGPRCAQCGWAPVYVVGRICDSCHQEQARIEQAKLAILPEIEKLAIAMASYGLPVLVWKDGEEPAWLLNSGVYVPEDYDQVMLCPPGQLERHWWSEDQSFGSQAKTIEMPNGWTIRVGAH